jgi:hypothetical protein
VVRFFVRVRVIRHQAEGIQVGCDSSALDHINANSYSGIRRQAE